MLQIFASFPISMFYKVV